MASFGRDRQKRNQIGTRVVRDSDEPGAVEELLFGGVENDGSIDWLVTGPPSDHAAFRVRCSDDSDVFGGSTVSFFIE